MDRDKLQLIQEKWNLRNMECKYKKSYKSVYSAESSQWGNVIVKENLNKDELNSEYNMLKLLDGVNACKVYAIDVDNCIMIEKQIIPGTELRNELYMTRRVSCFVSMFNSIHKDVNDCQDRKYYIDWIKKAYEFCINSNVGKVVAENMHKAYQIGCEMFEKYKDRVLLHGDLHHDNMLLGDNYEYYLIDPKGIVGPAIFDLPRFILNELDYVSPNEYKSHAACIINLIENSTGCLIDDIIKVFFIEVMLANVWNIEDGNEVCYHQIHMASELLNELE